MTNVLLRKPMGKGEATASGAGAGLLWGLDAGAEVGRGGGQLGAAASVVVWAVAVPLGTVIGAVGGNPQGLSGNEMLGAKQNMEKLSATILEMDLQAMLNREVFRTVTNSTRHRVVMADYAARPGCDSHTYRSLTNSRIDTVLEATVMTAGLAGPRSRNAPLTSFLEINVRLVRVRDDAELYVRRWFHHGGAQTLGAWGASEGQALQAELARAVPGLAEEIVEELFLRYAPP